MRFTRILTTLLPGLGFVSFLLLFFLMSLPARSADAQKRICIAPDEHTDYMWTADEETYRQAFLEMTSTTERLKKATSALQRMIDRHKVTKEIESIISGNGYLHNKTL